MVSEKKKHDKNFYLVLGLTIIVLIFSLGIGIYQNSQPFQDTYWHLSLAENLASGEGYVMEGTGGEPHSKYPPGLSILMLPFIWILGNIEISGLIVIAILSALAIPLTYSIGKISSEKLGVLAAVFLTFHNLFVFYTGAILTEIPFMFFSLAGLLFFMNGFEDKKRKYLAIGLIFIAFSCLIRYDGFFLIFPMIFYCILNWKKTKKIFYSDSAIIGIILGGLLIASWFLRNILAFGNPFQTAYASESFKISGALGFIEYFPYLGIIFPILVLIGIYFLYKEKNKKMLVFLSWFFTFIIVHMLWHFRALRFYVPLLPIMAILVSYSVFNIKQKIKNTSLKKYFIYIILGIYIILQFSIFFNFIPGFVHESTLENLNRYEPIRLISEYSDNNLPNQANYLVVDVPVYSRYMDKKNQIFYNQGLQRLLQAYQQRESPGEVYITADTLHSWATGPFLKGETGEIVLPIDTDSGKASLIIETELVKKINYKDNYAIIMKIVSLDLKQ
ncbi:MAG: ArnT family glycosyltransferase [Nanoarchaeota archaeon]